MRAAGRDVQHGARGGVCAAQCWQPGQRQRPQLHELPGVHNRPPQGQAHPRHRPLQLRCAAFFFFKSIEAETLHVKQVV